MFVANAGGFKLTKGETIVSVCIVLFSIIALFISYDKSYSAKRLFTLVIQFIGVLVLSISMIRNSDKESVYNAYSKSKWLRSILFLAAFLNLSIMVVCHFFEIYEVFGVEVGNYISGRYFGFQNTPALASGLGLCFLYWGFSSAKKSHKFLAIVSVLLTFFMTYTRAGLVAASAFLLVYFLLMKKTKINVLGYILLFSLAGALFVIIMFTGKNIDAMSSNRLTVWSFALQNSNPFIGNAAANIDLVTYYDVYQGGAHNAIIQTIYMCGYPMTFVLFGFIFTKIYGAISRAKLIYQHSSSYYQEYASLLSLAVAILVFCMFESHLIMIRCTISFMFFYGLYRIELISNLVNFERALNE